MRKNKIAIPPASWHSNSIYFQHFHLARGVQMKKDELDRLVEEIKKDDNKSFTITPRELINSFGWARRTPNCRHTVDSYLEKNMMEVEPSYVNSWVDLEITLRHKEKAKTKTEKDPIKKIMILAAANKMPQTVKPESSLKEATTLMMLNDYSQLPVMSGSRNPTGYISWNTIGFASANGATSELVKDYMKNDIQLLQQDTPLLDAIETICRNDFVVVIKNDKSPCGIVTAADIASQFLTITEPFVLLEQIENHLRQILHGKILVQDLESLCKNNPSRSICCIDDLNFGEYIRLMEDEKYWNKLELTIDRNVFIKRLDQIREIRNDIMHFDPEGITDHQLRDLKNMSYFLNTRGAIINRIT